MSQTLTAIPNAPQGRRGAIAALLVAQPAFGLGYQICAETLAGQLSQTALGASWFSMAAQSPWTWAMIAFDVASLASWIVVLSAFPLGVAFPLTSISYLLVMCTAWIGFHDPVHWMQVLGAVVILIGVSMLISGQNKDQTQ